MNYTSTYGSHSRSAGSGEVACTPVACENGLTSEDFGESSSYRSIVNKYMTAYRISSQLLQHFGENEARNLTPEECSISHRL